MNLLALISLATLLAGSAPGARPLPTLHGGVVVEGPGTFQQDTKLSITGHVILRKLTLQLNAPVEIAEGATLELRDVKLIVSDPPNSANGTSNLHCQGPANLVIHNSSIRPVGSAHPIWVLKGKLEVDGFDTMNSEFHLDHVDAKLNHFKIFELEISKASTVSASHLDLVFLSTHTGDGDRLTFSDIPTEKPFDKELALGSGAKARLTDTRIQIFLLYVHGSSQATLSQMARVQLAMFPDCHGSLRLPHGQTGTENAPAVFPQAGASDCPFQLTIKSVNVDTWDVYAGGRADLTFDHSVIDELVANDHAKLTVRDSNVYADWLAGAGDSVIRIENSTVGALRLAAERPDLATSEARFSGRSSAEFSKVRFDCGLVASGEAKVEIDQASTPPKYIHRSGNATVHAGATPKP